MQNTKGTTGSSRVRVTGYRLQEESSEWVILEEHMHFLVMRLARAKAELCSTGGHVLFRLYVPLPAVNMGMIIASSGEPALPPLNCLHLLMRTIERLMWTSSSRKWSLGSLQ